MSCQVCQALLARLSREWKGIGPTKGRQLTSDTKVAGGDHRFELIAIRLPVVSTFVALIAGLLLGWALAGDTLPEWARDAIALRCLDLVEEEVERSLRYSIV